MVIVFFRPAGDWTCFTVVVFCVWCKGFDVCDLMLANGDEPCLSFAEKFFLAYLFKDFEGCKVDSLFWTDFDELIIPVIDDVLSVFVLLLLVS